jgi:tetratricopeptide (TPR) repeat protein
MLSSRGLASLAAVALCVAFNAATEDRPVFDKGEKDDAEKGVVYKERKEDRKEKGKEKEKNKKSDSAKTVRYHIKGLKDPDPEMRETSCDMLGILGSIEAIVPLIDVLNPQRKEPLKIMMKAHAALVRITGKNFGYKSHDQWVSWWAKNKEDFLKKAETGVDPKDKIAAQAANEVGRQLMKSGEFKQASVHFLDAIDRDPSVPDYRNNLGLALMEQGRYLDAMEHFQEVATMDEELPQPYMNIGRCYSRMQRSIEAETWYKKASERDKEGRLWDLSWMIGKEYMQRAEWTIAYEYLDAARVKAQKNNVHDPRLYNDLAITHYGLDQYNSAWKELMNVRAVGFEPNAGFVAKVKQALIAEGRDPEADDKKAREVLARGNQPEGEELERDPNEIMTVKP